MAKKDADGVKANAASTVQKLAPRFGHCGQADADAEDAKSWQEHVDYGKEVEAYTEYALAFTAEQTQDPAKVVGLVDALIAENPKSKYLDELCANAYLLALGKSGGQAKQLDGMAKIVAGRPDNIVALMALTEGRPGTAAQNGNRLIAASKKAKPEGIAEAD